MHRNFFIAALGICALAACSGLAKKSEQSIEESARRADVVKGQTGSSIPDPGAAVSLVTSEPGIWIGKGAVANEAAQTQLPKIFSERIEFKRTLTSFTEFTQRITKLTKLPFVIDRSAEETISKALPASSGAAPIGAGSAANSATDSLLRLNYTSGDLKGLLDTFTARFKVYWRWRKDAIYVFLTETRAFSVRALPGDASLTSTLAGNSASGTSGATASGTSSVTMNTTALGPWKGIEDVVKQMMTSAGKMVVSQQLGQIVVTDTPDALDAIGLFINQQNLNITKQVTFHVVVLSVTLSDSDVYGINWGLVFNRASLSLGADTSSIGTATSLNGATLSTQILSTSSSPFAASQAVIGALSSISNVRRETSTSLVTINNQPVPLQVSHAKSYLQSATTTTSSTTGTSQTTLNPSTATEGINMTLLPNLLDDGRILLQFAASITELGNIASFTSGGQTIQLPESTGRSFLQRISLRSGETLVLSGFEQLNTTLGRSGVGSPSNFWLFGQQKATNSREILVLIITPIVTSL